MHQESYLRCSMCETDKPLERFYRDGRCRSGYNSRCKDCRRVAGKQAAELKRTADYAVRRAAAERRARKFAARLPKDFGNWLAGFIDGEGCFVIRRNTRVGGQVTYACEMRLSLRDDDRPIIEEMRARTGLGRIYDVPLNADRPARGAASTWAVMSKADVLALVAILDRFPLRAKKRNDYAIWREAVLCWATNYRKRAAVDGVADWSEMADLRERIVATRVYSAPG